MPGANRIHLGYSFPLLALLCSAFALSCTSPGMGKLEKPLASQTKESADQAAAPPSSLNPRTKIQVDDAYGRLPLHFMENQGQVDRRVRYYTRSGRHAIWFTSEGICFTFSKGRDQALTATALYPSGSGSGDAFVTKINALGNALVYSTYLGGAWGRNMDTPWPWIKPATLMWRGLPPPMIFPPRIHYFPYPTIC